jgi:hypothetical protein
MQLLAHHDVESETAPAQLREFALNDWPTRDGSAAFRSARNGLRVDPSRERGERAIDQARERDLVAAAFGRVALAREARGLGSSTSSSTSAFTARAMAAGGGWESVVGFRSDRGTSAGVTVLRGTSPPY